VRNYRLLRQTPGYSPVAVGYLSKFSNTLARVELIACSVHRRLSIKKVEKRSESSNLNTTLSLEQPQAVIPEISSRNHRRKFSQVSRGKAIKLGYTSLPDHLIWLRGKRYSRSVSSLTSSGSSVNMSSKASGCFDPCLRSADH
jgi:hypothetical protein